MLSLYPRSVPKFETHRNLLDDVDAEHINYIQRELSSVMESLGTNPHIYNDVNLPAQDVSAVPSDDGGLVTDESTWTGTYRYYDPKVQPVDHGSVGQRLDDIERGKQNHIFRLSGANNIDIGTSATGLGTMPRAIRFGKPNPDLDPFNYYNSWGVTLRKSGFWVFSGSVVYTLLGSSAGSNNGVYQAAIEYGGNWTEGMSRDQETGSNRYPILTPFIMGFFSRGTRVLLRTAQDSGRTQRIRSARLSGFLVREVT